MKQFERIFNNQTLNSVIEKEVVNLLSKKINSITTQDIDFKDHRKAVWLGSALAESDSEEHLKKVQDLAILLFLNNSANKNILKVVYILFSRIGNLAATNHLKELVTLNGISLFKEDLVLTQELIEKRANNSILINEKSHLITDFQKNLFTKLQSQRFLSISAPTSSGKSFILKKYIEQKLKKANKYCVYYIVPSRALINQVSEELRIELPQVQIKNAYIDEEILQTEKIIYVITPERAINIINSETNTIIPDLIFIDEIQNVENEDGRGSLFEYVFEELSNISNDIKIVTAGPFISNSNEIFKELFDKESEVVNTNLSPVFQLRTIIKLKSNFLSLTLFANNKVFYELNNIVEIKNIEKTFNSNIGAGLAQIMISFKDKNDNNLVYSSRGDYAEKWALKYSIALQEENKSNPDLEEELIDLIKFVKKEIHPKYYLIDCLQNKIAFHHSSLSEFVRKEIESLFESGIINTLFCTSTLLEGVNLPADNLFVVKPEKNTENLSDFEFGNLIGRAGRLKNTLYGSIFCVSKNNSTEWAEQYYKANYLKNVKTSSSRALPELNNEDLLYDGLQINEPKIRNTIISLRIKSLKNDGSLERFLQKHNLGVDRYNRILNSINQSVANVTIPLKIVKQNPTIDPLLQDKLYKIIIEDGVENWVIHPNSNFRNPYRRETAFSIPYKENSFFWQLDSIILRLDDIFKITYEVWKKDSFSISTTAICVNAVNWMEGKSMGELIADRLKYLSSDERIPEESRIDPTDQKIVNREIKKVIKINMKIITFSLLKYLKLLVNILENILSEEEKEKYKFTLALPIQIELGSQEPVIINLISKGIPRTIAIKLFDIFKKTDEYKNEIKIFDWMENQNSIPNLDPIYNKFLRKNKFI